MDRQPADCLEKPRGRAEESGHDRDHEYPGDDEHPAQRQFRAEFENRKTDHGDESPARENADRDRPGAAFKEERLHEESGLKTLAIDREKTDADEREPFPARRPL